MIVDCHVHLQPDRLARAVREFFHRRLPADVLIYPLDHATTLQALSDAGVTEVWNLPYAHKPGVAAGLNEASAALVAANPVSAVRITGAATVHPGDDHPERVVAGALDDLGLQAVKLHCSVGDYEADDPALDATWALLERRAVPTIVHAGHHVSGTTAAHELGGVDHVAARFPGVPIVIAHAAHPATRAALALLERHPNVYADLTPGISEYVALTDDELEQHCDRILYGSDAPNTGVRVEDGIARVRHLSQRAQDAILHGNAARLMAR